MGEQSTRLSLFIFSLKLFCLFKYLVITNKNMKCVFAICFFALVFVMVFQSYYAYADSAERSKIVYATNKDGDYEIYTMNAYGSGQTKLTDNSVDDYLPKFSPDGSKIVFIRVNDASRLDDFSGEVYIMNSDGSGQTRLTNDNIPDFTPTFSPDGTKIAECRSNGDNSHSSDIYVMNTDGSGLTRLTSSSAYYGNCFPAYSPDGTKIAFASNRDSCLFCGGNELYIMNADGSGQTRLTYNRVITAYPSFSPDGTQILFYSNKFAHGDVYITNLNGDYQYRLTSNPGFDGSPSFSPDGTKIVYSSDREAGDTGAVEIYVMNSTGDFGAKRLTNNLRVSDYPSYGPIQCNDNTVSPNSNSQALSSIANLYSDSPITTQGISFSASTSNICNNPPVAVAQSNPDKVVNTGSTVMLDGTKSHDPDKGDYISDYEWKITSPSNDIVENTLSTPTSATPLFFVPDYIPAEYTSDSTPPKLLPIDFSLDVKDNHGLKSDKPSEIELQVECNSADQQAAEYARDFVNQIIDPSNYVKSVISKQGYPQAIDNFGYWLHGKGDIRGLPEGITGKGVAKPLNINWLDSASEFRNAETTIMRQIQDEISTQLKQMSNGQTQQFVPSNNVYVAYITDKDKGYIGIPGAHLPTDFTVAVGAATVQVIPDLIITKKTGGSIVSGSLKLMLLDIYDFNSGKTFAVPGVGKVTSDQLHAAIKCLGARNFDQNTVYSKILTNNPISSFPSDVVYCTNAPLNSCKIQK